MFQTPAQTFSCNVFGGAGPALEHCLCFSAAYCVISAPHQAIFRGGGGYHACGTIPEKVSSLGKDWHRPCLKCAKCSKTLVSGSHAEHGGKPYCHNPCYSAMFGPGGFGRGGAESYKFK
uniref:LIM zinc-binding domain-containing protein n=1 Tax=Scophthalmus maximus TaxID=52904 RepID=A0A8D3AN76_SCOMX